MKRICIIILSILLLCVGCQQTPKSSLVVGKDQQQMIEKAQGDVSYPTDAPAGVDWAGRLGAPARYAAKLTSAGGHLTVDVDASVILPEGELPVARVSPQLFNDEDARRFAVALLGEDIRCVDPLRARTKAMLEAEILQQKEDLDHWEEYGSDVWSGYDDKAEFEDHLEELVKEAAQAPETLETFAPTWTWETLNVWTQEGKQQTSDRYMLLKALNEDGIVSSLRIDSCSEYSRSGVRYVRGDCSYIHFPLLGYRWPNELPMNREAAQATAEDTLQRMGLGHLACAFARSVRCYRGDTTVEGNEYRAYWAFVFTLAVNGTPLTCTDQPVVEPNEYNRAWEYEQCRVLVDEKGIALLEYAAPCTLEATEVEAAKLLPFETIREIFEKMVLIVNNMADSYSCDDSYRITEVRLGLVTVPAQNGDGGLLVPCWDFLGAREPDDYLARLRDKGVESDDSRSFLTINAIDGSIILRQ